MTTNARILPTLLRDCITEALPHHKPKRGIVLDTHQLIASWNTWYYPRNDCKHSVDQAKDVVRYGLEAVLRPADEHGSRKPIM